MSTDLISRKETERLLKEYANDVCMRPGENPLANGICKAACFVRDNIPDTYDMNRAIQKIEQEILDRKDRLNNVRTDIYAAVYRSEMRGLEKALDIIKKEQSENGGTAHEGTAT